MNDDVAALDAQRRELQRRVFSASSDAADARVAARQLQQIDSRRMKHALEVARHTTAALEQDSPPSASTTAPPPVTEGASTDENDGETGHRSPDDLAVPGIAGRAPSPFSVARFAAAVLLALTVGLAIGMSATPRPGAVPESAPSRPVVDTTAALALFDRPQVDADLPAQTLPGTVIAESIRAIGDPFFELFIGRNAANMVCLFAVQPADAFAMSCVTIDEFPSTGVRLEWSGEMSSISADGTTGTVPSTMRAIWRPDGSLDLGGGPR